MLPTRRESTILRLLIKHGSMYGLQLVDASDSTLVRGTIYVTLGRMQDKGLVESRLEDPQPRSIGPARRFYTITDRGRRALEILELVTAELAPEIST